MIPPFNTLEPLAGHPELREVNGTWITEEAYLAEGWHVTREFKADNGKTVRYWACSIKGIQDYGRKVRERKEERRSSWQARVEREEEYSEEMNRLLDEGGKK